MISQGASYVSAKSPKSYYLGSKKYRGCWAGPSGPPFTRGFQATHPKGGVHSEAIVRRTKKTRCGATGPRPSAVGSRGDRVFARRSEAKPPQI